MKLWMKYLLGIVLGVASAFIIPLNSPQSTAILDFVVNIVLRIGRYALIPSLFFGAGIAVFRLRDGGLTSLSAIWIVSTVVASTALLAFLGTLSAVLIKLPPLPITAEKSFSEISISVTDLIMSVFPESPVEAFLEGTFLLPCCVFGGAVGGACATDKSASKQAVGTLESFSNVAYSMLCFFSDMMTIGIMALSCRWALNFATVLKAGVFLPLITILTVNLLLVAFVIYPLILRFICHDPRPFKVLYASVCPFLTAFFSGDTNLTLLCSMRHGKDSLGIRRRTNAVTFPVFSIFARGGSVLVTSICFVVILRTYSYLEISFSDTLWIGTMSFLLSFVLGGFSSGGPFVALTILCTMYGRGFSSGYLLLRTASPIICAYAAGIDAITAMFGSYIVAVKTRTIEHRALKQFI